MSLSATDRGWLDAAVALAEPMLGTTAENPTVGAIVVGPDRSVLGRGVTAPGGRPHAEPQALSMAGAAARGASLYVTLEPCNHWGRTPPCVDALIDAGIGRIVIGIADPDPRTAGQGIARLRAAGIEVDVADHAVSARLHEGFVSRVTLGRPFVTAKLAVSPDGRIGRRDQGNVRITGEDARRWTHRQRSRSDAVMVGAGTARLDNPRLNVRLPGLEQRKPLRLVVAGRHALDANLTLFASATDQPVAVIGSSATPVPSGIGRIDVPAHDGRPDLHAALQALGALGISTLLVEGGGALNDALLDAGLIDRFCLLDGIVPVGADGVRASAHGSLEARLAQAGLTLVDQQRLGVDKLRTFEKA